MRKHRAFLKSKVYTVELIDAIEDRMREHHLSANDIIQMMFRYASNDFLESIRDRIELEAIRKRYLSRLPPPKK